MSGPHAKAHRKPSVLVTGASSGLGNACATYLAKHGWAVFGTSRNPDAAVRKADEFFDLLAMELGDDESVGECVALAAELGGGLDAVVCNAGMGVAGPLEEAPMESVKSQMDINLLGTIRVLKAALPLVRKSRGTIIVVGSMAGRMGIPFQSLYSASKFALEGLVESLRMELTGTGVRLTIVEPGDFRTGFTAARRTTPAAADGPYAASARKAIETMEKDERAGAMPIVFARMVIELLESTGRLKVRYPVGMFFQRFALFLKWLLPARLFERIFASYYGCSTAPK